MLLDDSPSASDLEAADVGYFGSSAVVLLSDGENTAEPDPLAPAELASTAGVRIHPIGIGSAEGTVLEVDGFQVATALDERLLRQIAETTDGTYYAAADESPSRRSTPRSSSEWSTEARRLEVTALFAAGAAVLLLAGALLSLVRSGRVV